MKLVDPLSVMQFMGGSLPIHLSMLYYGFTILYVVRPDVKCWYGFRGNTTKSLFDDVWVMFVVHIVCVCSQLLKGCCNTHSDFGATFRTLLKFVYVFSYLFAIVFITEK